jgi:glycosyltransferase involved in cell wall biosynthesis
MTQLLSRNPGQCLPTVPYASGGLLSSLPVPPDRRTGWPWTKETAPLPLTQANGESWPKVTIVTPSYNQGEFIEETIRSVLLQNYPNLEYIVMDGGSTDDTVAILKKYSPWISLWQSEKDNGQSHAINKGFKHATGVLRGYLNSDDLLLQSSLKQVTDLVALHSEQPLLILGDCEFGKTVLHSERTIMPIPPVNLVDTIGRDGVCPQPATFWTYSEQISQLEFNQHLNFCMDFDFWCELVKHGYKPVKLDAPLAFYRYHTEAKGATITDVFWSELAGLALLKLNDLQSFEEKLHITTISRRRLRHYLRLEIQKLHLEKGKWAALQALLKACWTYPDLLAERITLGLARSLLFASAKAS